MKRHAAFPHFENLQRIIDEVAGPVEQDIAQSPTEDDAKRGPNDEIIDMGAVDPANGSRGKPHRILPAQHDAKHVGERVPADDDRPKPDRDGVDGWKGNGVHWRNVCCGAVRQLEVYR